MGSQLRLPRVNEKAKCFSPPPRAGPRDRLPHREATTEEPVTSRRREGGRNERVVPFILGKE